MFGRLLRGSLCLPFLWFSISSSFIYSFVSVQSEVLRGCGHLLREVSWTAQRGTARETRGSIFGFEAFYVVVAGCNIFPMSVI